MNELSDDEIRAALDAAGRGPTDESRAHLRAALLDDEIGDDYGRVVARRRIGWIVGGAAAVAAAVLIAVVLVDRPDEPRLIVAEPTDPTEVSIAESVAPVTSVAPSTSVASAPVDPVSGRRWVLDGVGDEPWNGAVLPFFDFTITGSTWTATGSGGCNEIALRGGVADDSLVVEEWESTAAACAGGDDLAPSAGTLRLDASGRLVADDGDLTYVALDDVSTLAAPADLIGSWSLNGWSPRIDITASSATIGTCAVQLTPVAGGIRFDGWPQEPSDCLGSDPPYVAALLLDLVTRPVTAYRSEDRLILFGDSRGAVQLSRVDLIAEPDRITIEAGAAFGLVPGGGASADTELIRIEQILGPVDHDTGWYSVPLSDYSDGTADCLGGRDYRVLWWGDLSLAFWRADDVPESLWAWSVGDKRVSLWGDRRETYSPPADASSGLATETGIAIGTSEGDVLTTYGALFTKFDPLAEDFGGTVYDSGGYLLPYSPTGASVGATFLVRDGVVVGFGASLRFC